jgi:hypothetical protein
MAATIKTKKIGSGEIDMEVLNLSMAKNPQILKDLYVNLFARKAPFSTFVSNLGVSDNEEVLPSNMIRWAVWGHPDVPTYVLSVSTTTPTVGVPFEITLSNGFFRANAVLRTQVTNHNIFIKSNGVPSAGGTRYTAEYIGTAGQQMPVGVLVPNSQVSYLTAAYGEASETGHPLPFVTGPDYYTNVMTLTRHKEGITGSAMTEAIIYEDTKFDPLTNENKLFRGMLPVIMKDGRNLIEEHIYKKEMNYIYGVSNFDPATGKVFTIDADGKPVPMGDGFIRQFEQGRTVHFDPKMGIPQIAQLIKNMRQFVTYNMGAESMDLYVMGGNLAKLIYQDVLTYEHNKTGVTIQKVLGKDAKDLMAGIEYTGLQDMLGSLKFIYNPVFDDKTNPSLRVAYAGQSFSAESGDMYFFFVKKTQDGKTNIRTFSKGKNFRGHQVDRRLVYGYIPGMTGWAKKNIGSRAAASMEQYSDYMQIATGRDAEQFEVLSETMLILANPSEFGLLKVNR